MTKIADFKPKMVNGRLFYEIHELATGHCNTIEVIPRVETRDATVFAYIIDCGDQDFEVAFLYRKSYNNEQDPNEFEYDKMLCMTSDAAWIPDTPFSWRGKPVNTDLSFLAYELHEHLGNHAAMLALIGTDNTSGHTFK